MTCPECGATFQPRTDEGGTPQLYCSQRCMRRVAQRRYAVRERAAINRRWRERYRRLRGER
jgi:hypothetical protein